MTVPYPRTVGDWLHTGHRGLRIPACPSCGTDTAASWGELGASDEEDVIAVARRLRCWSCGEAPAGLGVVATTEPGQRVATQ